MSRHGHDDDGDRGHSHDHAHDHDFTDRTDRLSDPAQYRYLSAEELRAYLDPGPDWTVADLGSGTGLFTDELAPVADRVYAIDIRPGLHDRYNENGMAPNVVPILADFSMLPFPDDHLDGAVSIRTFHHGFEAVLEEVVRVLRPGGRLVVVDWSATATGEKAGREDEFFDLAEVQSILFAHGFRIVEARERRDTFVVVAARR